MHNACNTQLVFDDKDLLYVMRFDVPEAASQVRPWPLERPARRDERDPPQPGP
jgi:hypothetical protein